MRFPYIPKTKAIFTLLVGIAFFLSGCYPREALRKPPERPPLPDPFLLAEQDFREGKFAKAIEGYYRYLELYPEGEKERTALYRIAKAKEELGDFQGAILLLDRAVREFPDHPDAPVLEADITRLYYQSGDYEKSAASASLWLEKHPSHPLRRKVSSYLGRCLDVEGDKAGALKWYVQAVTGPDDGTVNVKEIQELIIALVHSASLQDLQSMEVSVSGTPYAPSLYYQMALKFLESGELPEAKEAAAALVRSSSEQFWVDIGRDMLKTIEEELSVRPGVIGCLLPLSGPFAIYGQEVLNGIQLGMGLFQEKTDNQPLELVIKDTAGDPDTAVRALEELASQDKAVAVIGPLASKPAQAAARRAQELGVPIITLTQRQGIATEGSMVFRNFLTPSKQVESIVDKALKMNLKRFAILYPDNSYGRFFMNLFWDKVEELGGEIRAVETYRPDQTDFEVEIKKMVGLYYPRPESVSRMLEEFRWLRAEEKIEDIPFTDEEPEPLVDFDAVFIPDNYQTVALIAPQFPFHNVFDVRFLGTSLWQSPELIELAGDYLQGALIPVGFYPHGDGDSSRELEQFISTYRASFESEPGILSATGYDTMRFLKEIINNNGPVKTRRELRRHISSYADFFGVTGWIAFDRYGEVVKDPLILTISGKTFRIVH
ncbi:MAG: penicillin-binding protein activator [Deltaproteobacteria bacterium]|nr:penicillin-binding protein activator [Deltaproteobacteria bacterium]MBW2138643.1 penicillin-binding protein activator [Deltaproteobacteria bacterium]